MPYIKTKKYNINVIKSSELAATMTSSEKEMDKRVKAAVKSAISKAKICKLPVAGYDSRSKKAYIELANGEKRYVK